MGDDNPVSLRDVYDLVGESRKELSTQIEKVNGEVVDLKVDVGKVNTRMESQDVRIEANTNALGTLRDAVQTQRIRSAQLGGIAGVVVTGALKVLEWVLAQIPG